MKSQTFEVFLESDIHIKGASTVEGQQPSLDYLPGRLFLGVAAARLYRQGASTMTWDWFHSGKVRFGDGLPLSAAGEMGFPTPMSLHEKKENPIATHQSKDDAAHAPSIGGNLAAPEPAEFAQWRALKGGYLNEKGHLFQPTKLLRLKTAIDPEKGRVVHQQLFATQAIRRGQRFCFEVCADDDLDGESWQRLLAHLEGPARLGGSRSAEFGAVRLSPIAKGKGLKSDSRWNHQKFLCLWLLADAFLPGLMGDLGQPPDPADWGIEGARFCWSRSFIEHQTLARFNGAYKRFEREQYLTKRGSVLIYKLNQPLTYAQLVKLAEQGIGLDRHQGLGRVWVNPPMLLEQEPSLAYASLGADSRQHTATMPDHPVATWLTELAEEREFGAICEEQAGRWFGELDILYRSATLLEGAGQDHIGPSARQWGLVREAIREWLSAGQTRVETLEAKLFDEKRGICRGADLAWCAQVRLPADVKGLPATERSITFGCWLRLVFEGKRESKTLPQKIRFRAMALLARRAMSKVKQRIRGGKAGNAE